ncbi:DNA polymerase-3 subunit beta [Bacilli bacterium PM5-3]|nr:DNA polymerase-3 subunit beta [Bacilli bacterium PM5-3]
MKFKIQTNSLLQGLSKVNHVVNNKSPIPSLNGIYFRLDSSNLTLIGSDSDITIKCIIDQDIEIINQGRIVIPKFIVEIIKKIDDEWVELELIDNSLIIIKSKKSEFKINGISADNFPNIDFSLNGDKINISTNIINSIISETAFATSQEEIRPVLTGVNFSCEDSVLTCVATDSFRLAKKKINIESNFNFNINVPAKCLFEVSKLIKENKNIDVFISQQRILFNLENIVIQSRLINGNYPDISKLIPESYESTLKVNKKVIHDSLDRANVLSINSSNYTVTLEKNSNMLTLYSKSQEVGSIQEDVSYLDFDGKELLISFNSRYVNDALKSFNDDIVCFYFNGAMSPFIIKSEENDSSTQLILPIKTY